MRRKLLLSFGLAMIAVLALAGIAVGSSDELTQPQTIHVVQTGGKITFLKVNPNKDTFIGDQVVVNGPVWSADGPNSGRPPARNLHVDGQARGAG